MLYKKVEKDSTLSPKKPKVEYLSPNLGKNQLKWKHIFKFHPKMTNTPLLDLFDSL